MLAQFHHRRSIDDAINRDRQLRLPSGGNAPDAIGNCVNICKQALTFAQQFAAGLGQARLSRTTIEEQYVQRIFHLPHPISQGAGNHVGVPRRGGKAAGSGYGLQHGQCIRGQYIARSRHGVGLAPSFNIFE